MPPKNILYLSTFGNLKWGGQKSLFYLLDRLDNTKYRPHVVLPADEDFAEALRQREIPVSILELPKIKGFSIFAKIGALLALRRIIRQNRIDLIHADGPRNTVYGGVVAKLEGIPLVFHVRSSERDRYDRLLYLLSTRLILVADALKARFKFAGEADKIITIHNGVDLNDFKIASTEPRIRKKHNIPAAAPLIACLGRIEPMKGQLCLIEAYRRFYKEHDSLQLLFAGDVVDEGYLEKCRQTARSYGIEERTIFAGHEPDIPGLLNEIDIFVSASSFGEAFSRAIIEAMAAGKPIIATDVGGAREAVVDGETGFIVLPGDSEAMAEKLRLLLDDSELRRQMGGAARKRVETLFTIDRNVALTERLYDEIFTGRRN